MVKTLENVEFMGQPASPAIVLRDLGVDYDNRPVLQEINLEISTGCVTGMIGPNGSGKTTLLKSFIRQLPFHKGQVFLFGRNIARMNIKDIARKVGVVPQKWQTDFSFTARDFVGMGRYPYAKSFAPLSPDDRSAIDQAMKATSTLGLAHRPVSEMSGGELQRVVIAQALAQDPEILLLDEPTSSLDISHQIEVCELMQDLAHRHGMTVVMVLHDLNLAGQFCDRLILLKNGRIFAHDDTPPVLTTRNLKELFNSNIRVIPNNINGKPYVVMNPAGSLININDSTGPFRIHMIGGGGALSELMFQIHAKGFQISAGVLNVLDTDWTTTRELGIPTAEEAPFSPIGDMAMQANLNLIREADLIILGNLPFGEGNLRNLEATLAALKMGKRVWICDFTALDGRDFTKGSAALLYDELKRAGAVFYQETPPLISQLNNVSQPKNGIDNFAKETI